jgi:ATP-binding cassette subfamily B protein
VTRWTTYREQAIRPRLAILRRLPEGGPALVAGLVTVNVALAVLPLVFVVMTSVLIGRVPQAVEGGVGSAAWGALVTAFLWAAAAFLGQQVLAPVQATLGELLRRRIDGRYFDRVMAAALGSTGVGPLEDQATLDALHEASEQLLRGFQTPGRAAAGQLALIARYGQLLGCCVLVAAVVSPWVALVLFVSVMAFRYGQRGGLRKFSQVWRTIAPLRREVQYLSVLGTGAVAAKEIRIFGLHEWISARVASAYRRMYAPIWAERRRIYFAPFLVIAAIGLFGACIVFVTIGRDAARGIIDLTALALGLQASIQALMLGNYYAEADVQTQFGMLSMSGLERFEALVAGAETKPAPPQEGSAGEVPVGEVRVGEGSAGEVPVGEVRVGERSAGEVPVGEVPVGEPPQHEIAFRGLGFGYPGSSHRVFDELDLTLPAGLCTAIVGLNGAGKTTLVKLLTRLYQPDAGDILADGTNIADLPVDAWRKQVGVIFQDFVRYELTAAENVSLGAVERPADREAVRSAAQRAGMAEFLADLPSGFDTVLHRQYPGGVDLSGGQWQRVAIARALYALDAGAKVLVLDEPTAALDVRAEAEFFDRFVDLTRGVTSLLISHRFSSVRRADRIVVLEHGRVIEEGSHESLLERGGRYAELFTLQAQRFTEQEERFADREEVSP